LGMKKAAESSTIVLLIRHGQTPTTGQVLPGRAPGLHLAPRGHEQARDVSSRLEGLDLQAVYSSPMVRAQEIADPTAGAQGQELLIADHPIECELGQWTGEKLTEPKKLPAWKEVQTSPSTLRFPDGESFVEMQERMVEAVPDIAQRHPGEVTAA